MQVAPDPAGTERWRKRASGDPCGFHPGANAACRAGCARSQPEFAGGRWRPSRPQPGLPPGDAVRRLAQQSSRIPSARVAFRIRGHSHGRRSDRPAGLRLRASRARPSPGESVVCQGAIDVAHFDRVPGFVGHGFDGRDESETIAGGKDIRFQSRRFHIQPQARRRTRRLPAGRCESDAQGAAGGQHAGTRGPLWRTRDPASHGDGPGKGALVLRGHVDAGGRVSGAESAQRMPLSRRAAPALQKRRRSP